MQGREEGAITGKQAFGGSSPFPFVCPWTLCINAGMEVRRAGGDAVKGVGGAGLGNIGQNFLSAS